MSLRLLARRAAMEVKLKTSRLAQTVVRSLVLGFETWNPPAPGMGEKSLVIANRVFLSLPHQPARRGWNSLSPCPFPSFFSPFVAVVVVVTALFRSCTNNPPIAPGPELRYLYVHHAAASTFQSWSDNGTFPTAWARSQTTKMPRAWA